MAFDLSKLGDDDKQYGMNGNSAYFVSSIVFTCRNCGHVLYPGESHKKCSVCGSTDIDVARDRSKRVEVQCAA